MKVVALVSGGKDSCYAMMRCIDYGHEIVALANLMPLDDAVDELDSYMYQTVGHQIVVSYAECMGLPLFRRRIRGSMRHQSLSYAVTPGDEVEDMFVLLNEVKRQIPAIAAVSSGAIASDYQRLRVESVCARLRLVSLAYLWKQDQTILLEEMIRRNIVALTIKVAAMGLNPAKHLGREISDLKLHLLQMKELYGINVCGEGGEYETLTTDCPLFTNARIVLDKFQVILHSPGSIAPVAVLHPLAFHLEHKKEVRNNNESDKMGYVYEVQGETEPVQMVRCQSMDVASATIKEPNLCMSIRRDMFSIGCWSRGSLKSSEDLQEDLTAVLRRIGSQLCDEGFDWVNVLYIHLYISDMNQFALVNEVYVKFITEKKCYLGVPSRSTIELPLVHAGLGNAYVEVLVADDRSKKVLHVQSISCWAPSCIGPYSQATLHKEVLYMAGQLGLDPPTMNLCSGGATSEMQQALENCEAVANSFNSSIASAIIFAIYCSTSLTPCERAEIQSTMDNYLQRISNHQTCDPIFVYVSAPNLPKGALVEVKPVLHVPEIGNEVQPILWQTSTTKTPNCWHLEYSEWHDSCCQIHAVRGKICAALVSITKDELANICFKSDQNLADATRESSGKNIKIILRFCIYLLDKILFETDFSWKELTNLRLYFTADLSVTADALSLIISEVFNEFAEFTKKIELGKLISVQRDLLKVVQLGYLKLWRRSFLSVVMGGRCLWKMLTAEQRRGGF